MYEHASGYTVNAALALARDLEYGPVSAAGDPTPSAAEAIAIIRRARKGSGFNWITGEVAAAVASAYRDGIQAPDDAVSPYPTWSDEHRAWLEGKATPT